METNLFTQLTEDDRRLLLVALKTLYNEIDKSIFYGFPVIRQEVREMVLKLGGKPEYL